MPISPQGPIEVLVTGGNSRPGLAVARSLTQRGISCVILADAPDSLAFHSRLIKYAVRCPSPIHQPNAFMEFTLTLIRKHDIQLAIPVAESTLLLFDQHREALDGHVGLLEDMEIRGRVARELIRIGPQQHTDRVVSQVEVSGDDESVAGVVPLAATDHNRPGHCQLTQRIGDPPAGVFHQHQAGNSVFRGGAAVEFSGLLAVERR